MARGKGNSGPRSRTNSPVNANQAKNGHKTGGSGGADGDGVQSKKVQSEKTTPTPRVSKQKSPAKELSQEVEDVRKLKRRAASRQLLVKSDNTLETDVGLLVPTFPEKSEVRRCNVAKKSTTQAAAREAMKLKKEKYENQPKVIMNGKLIKREKDVVDVVDIEDNAVKSSPPMQLKVKLDVDFEDDSSEDSENEGLKQRISCMMEDMDQSLVLTNDKKSSSSTEAGGVVDKPVMPSGEQLWLEMVACEKTTSKVDGGGCDVEEPRSKNRKRVRSGSLSPVVCLENGSFELNKTVNLKTKIKSKKIDDIKNNVGHPDFTYQIVEECDDKTESPNEDGEPEVLSVKPEKLKDDQTEDEKGDKEKKISKEDETDKREKDDETSIVVCSSPDLTPEVVSKSSSSSTKGTILSVAAESDSSSTSMLSDDPEEVKMQEQSDEAMDEKQEPKSVEMSESLKESSPKPDVHCDAANKVDEDEGCVLKEKEEDKVVMEEKKAMEEVQQNVEEVEKGVQEVEKAVEEVKNSVQEVENDVQEVKKDVKEVDEDGKQVEKDVQFVEKDAQEVKKDVKVEKDEEEVQKNEAEASKVEQLPTLKSQPEVCASTLCEKTTKDDAVCSFKEVLKVDKPHDVENDEEVVEIKDNVEPLLKRKREDLDVEQEEEGGTILSGEKKVKLDVENQPKTDTTITVVASMAKASVPERSMLRRVFGVQRQPLVGGASSTAGTTKVNDSSTTTTSINGSGAGDVLEDLVVAPDDMVVMSEDVVVTSETVRSSVAQEVMDNKRTPSSTATTATDKKTIYRMSKAELEMLVMTKVTEYFTDSDKSEIGALRRRCEDLEKALELSKRKGSQYQKQLTDLQIVIQREQSARKPGTYPTTKPMMRSVGLQVQLTRYIPVSTGDVSKTIIGQRLTYTTTGTATTVRPSMPPSAMGVSTATAQNVQRMTTVKQIPSGVTFLSSMAAAAPVTRTYLNATRPAVPNPIHSGNFTATPIRTGSPIIRLPIGEKTFNVRPLTGTSVSSNQLGVSLLQPRMSLPNSQVLNTNLVFSAPIFTNATNAPNLVKRVSPMKTPASPVTGMRPHLEASKIVSVTSGVTPVPMRLVPNQAARQPTNAGGIVTSLATVGTTCTVVSPNKNPLIGQPKLATVKLIDLTADEEAAAAVAAAASGTGTTSSSPLTLSTINTNPSQVKVVQAGRPLQTAGLTNTVSVLSSGISSSAGQILTINPSGTISTTTMNSLRMGAPMIRTTMATGIGGSAPMRYAYIVPSTSMVTVVRPNQSLFVTQNQGQRLGQPGTILKPTVPTLVFQRGTTLVPIQGQVALQNIRPGQIQLSTPLSTTTSTITITTNSTQSIQAALPTINPPSNPMIIQQLLASTPIASTVATTETVPATKVALASAPAAATSVVQTPASTTSAVPKLPLPPLLPAPNNANVTHRPIISATVTATSIATMKGNHPAPLPSQPTYTKTDLVSRKCIPPKPVLKISKVTNGIVLSWNMPLNMTYADIGTYQLYAYQEGTSAPSSLLWKKVGDVKALPLPMACTLTQFVEGHKYYFAVRAVDAHSRIGPFSEPGSIALMVANPATVPSKPSQAKS